MSARKFSTACAHIGPRKARQRSSNHGRDELRTRLFRVDADHHARLTRTIGSERFLLLRRWHLVRETYRRLMEAA